VQRGDDTVAAQQRISRRVRAATRLLLPLLLATGLAGCGGDAGDPPAAPAAPPAPPAPTATTTPGPGKLPGPGNVAQAGSYAPTRYKPALTFELAEPWRLLFEGDTTLAFAPPEVSPTAPPDAYSAFSFSTIEQVFRKPLVGDEELTPANRRKLLQAAPKDIIAWLRSNKYLEISAPKESEVGGRTATQLDITVKDLPDQPKSCGTEPLRCVTLFASGGDNYVMWEGYTTRFLVLEGTGAPVVVTIEAPKGELEPFAAKVQPVLDSVEFP
jgi:hypothetical protein